MHLSVSLSVNTNRPAAADQQTAKLLPAMDPGTMPCYEDPIQSELRVRRSHIQD